MRAMNPGRSFQVITAAPGTPDSLLGSLQLTAIPYPVTILTVAISPLIYLSKIVH